MSIAQQGLLSTWPRLSLALARKVRSPSCVSCFARHLDPYMFLYCRHRRMGMRSWHPHASGSRSSSPASVPTRPCGWRSLKTIWTAGECWRCTDGDWQQAVWGVELDRVHSCSGVEECPAEQVAWQTGASTWMRLCKWLQAQHGTAAWWGEPPFQWCNRRRVTDWITEHGIRAVWDQRGGLSSRQYRTGTGGGAVHKSHIHTCHLLLP